MKTLIARTNLIEYAELKWQFPENFGSSVKKHIKIHLKISVSEQQNYQSY